MELQYRHAKLQKAHTKMIAGRERKREQQQHQYKHMKITKSAIYASNL